MRQQFATVTEANINMKIGAFFAQSADHEGGRKERVLKRQNGAVAAAVNDDDSIAHSSDQEQ